MHAERAIIASAPWQAWLLDVRSVYRWESPARTGKWLAIYVVVWYTGKVLEQPTSIKILNDYQNMSCPLSLGRPRPVEIHSLYHI